MSIMAFLGGILIGGLLGAMGMFFLIKETHMDLNEDEIIYGQEKALGKENAPELEEGNDLEEAKEVKYGGF